MKLAILACFFVIAPDGFSEQGEFDDLEFFAAIDSLAWSESFGLTEILGETRGNARSGTRILGNGHGVMGLRSRNWEVAYIVRADHFVKHSRDLSKLISLQNNDLPLATGQTYNLDADVEVAHTNGLRVGYIREFSPSLRLGLRVSYLRGFRLISARSGGRFSLTEESLPLGSADFNYYSGSDYLFGERYAEPRGQGYAVDFLFGWGITRNWFASIEAKDAIHNIKWRDAPQTIANVDSTGLGLDGSNRLVSRPLISGKQSLSSYDQSLPIRVKVGSSYRFNVRSKVSTELFISDGNILPAFSYFGRMNKKTRWSFDVRPSTGGYGFGIHRDNLSVSLGADALSESRARFVALNVSLTLRLVSSLK